MSWYTDPELFMYYWNSSYGYGIGRIKKQYNNVIYHEDITYEEGQLNFYRHLYLGNNNNETDYAALKYILAKNADVGTFHNVMYVNCKGLVVYCTYKPYSQGRWSRVEHVEELNPIFYCLPGITNSSGTASSEKIALEKKNSDLVTENSNLTAKLNEQLNRVQALEKQLSDLTAKLEECRGGAGDGSADVKPWMSGDTAVPSHWVPFEELDVLNLPKNTPATIMEGPSNVKFLEDVTTNVLVNRFYRGTFIVAVNVAELSPDNEMARFDPEFWGLYNNAGVTYAARKPLKSEMSV